MTILAAFFTVIWGMVRKEANEHAIKIEQKVDQSRFHELEGKFDKDITLMRTNNEKVIEQLSHRHDKDLATMSQSFKDQLETVRSQILSTEANILAQMRLIMTFKGSQ